MVWINKLHTLEKALFLPFLHFSTPPSLPTCNGTLKLPSIRWMEVFGENAETPYCINYYYYYMGKKLIHAVLVKLCSSIGSKSIRLHSFGT